MNQYFAYIWKFTVRQEHIEEFKKIYGPEGDWVQLFSQADGFVATDLHQDNTDRGRFITVDVWKSKVDRNRFQMQFSKEFEALDKYCEQLTEDEKLLGEFNSHIGRFAK